MKTTRKTLTQFGYQSKKSRGQNFLIDEKILQQIAQLASINPEEYLLEIGPGPGSLTKYLVKKAKKVFAVEIERQLAQILKRTIPAENLEIIEADILQFDFKGIKRSDQKLKVISNLPFNISTPVLFKLLETPGVFSELYLTLQKEVAERIVAHPKTRDYGILAIIAQVHSEPEIILRIGPEAFRPRPKVHSALVKFKILDQPGYQISDYPEFKKVIKACFSQRRKLIINSLAGSGLNLEKDKIEQLLTRAEISPRARAEEIEIERLVRLANLYHSEKESDAGIAGS